MQTIVRRQALQCSIKNCKSSPPFRSSFANSSKLVARSQYVHVADGASGSGLRSTTTTPTAPVSPAPSPLVGVLLPRCFALDTRGGGGAGV